MVAFSWPAWDLGEHPDPTTIGVYRVSDGQRVSLIKCAEPSAAVLLPNPPRIATLRRRVLGDGWGDSSFLDEKVEVFDAQTGQSLKKLSLTPEPPATKPESK